MKKWMIVSLLALLTMLLLCAACAEDGHKWEWDYNDKTHALYCNGCATHTNRIIDEASSGAHTYTCEWPQSESNGGKGKIYLDLVCKCGKRVKNVEAQSTGGTDPTCTNTGSHTYEYMGGSEYPVTGGRSKTYTVPETKKHEYRNYTPNNDATCTKNETETALCIYNCNTTDTRDIPNSALGHDPEQHPAKAATCTEPGCNAYETCKRTGCNYTTYQKIDPLNHDPEPHPAKAATCTEPGYKAYETCKRTGCDYTTYQKIDPLNHDLEQHDAKAATCTEPGYEAYETCKRMGCDYTTYQEIPATGHSYAKKVVKPTCEKGGYTKYTCAVCGDQYTDQRTGKLLHWFGEWTANDDGTHSAACKRKNCDHTGKADCTMQEVKLGDGTLTLCPVCGDTQDNKTFALIEGATAKAVTKHLPLGDPILRVLQLEDGAALLSAGFEYAGKLTRPTGEVEFTLPAALIEGKTLSVLNADDAHTPLACTIDGDIAAFTLDFTDTEIPVQLIHVAPAA